MKKLFILGFFFWHLASSETVQAQQTAAKPFMGVTISSDSLVVNPLRKQLGLKDKGVLVQDVLANSSALAGGIQKNDFIVQLNDSTINQAGQLVAYVQTFKVGDKVNVSLYRNKKLIVKSFVLKPRTN